MMKKFSIMLVFVFLTSLTTAQTTNTTTAKGTCQNLLAGLEPCTVRYGRNGFFTRLVTPINATCCDQINEIGDTCPRMYRRRWFARAHLSCKPEIPSPSPQPSPPVKTCDFTRVRPCLVEMSDYIFGRSNLGISADCCSTLIDVEETCGPDTFRWPFFGKSLDYCQNHH